MNGELRDLQLKLLGEPQATLDGKPLTGFISAKAEALLYFLATTGQPHSREILANLLWSEMAEATAKKNLTKALSNLRRLVDPYLSIDYHTAGFRPDEHYWLDVRLFEDIAAAREPELGALRQAAALYQGDFLAGFFVKDAPVFEEWVLAEQERLRLLLLRMLESLAARLAAGNEYAAAIEYTQQLLALDPYREPAHRQMMHLLARSGQRSAALAQYETCRRLLANELGAEPMAETQALYERLKATGAPPPHNLPQPSTVFVGRMAELTKIISLLNDPACRLLTIAGPGGIGKTRLAVQAAAHYVQPELGLELEQKFSDGVYWVRLAPLDSAEAIVPILAEIVGLSFQPQSEPQQQLLNYLGQKSMLLVMDNFEQLLAGNKQENVAWLTRMLEDAPDIKILVTSRVRLNLQGEHLLYLAGMDYPEQLVPGERPVEEIAGYGSVQLFLQSARRVQLDFELTSANAQDVLQICRLVQGMPLAILLAAAWVEMLSPAEIAAEISHSLDFLATNMRDLPERQRSIRAVFDHSWELLTERERDIFAQLSIFRGHFSRQAAQAVTGAALPDLMGLVNKSLLRHMALGRYLVHELLRQFAVEKLNLAADGGQAARGRHSAYYTALLEQMEAELKGPGQQPALAQIDADSENVRVAWYWAVEQAEIGQLGQAMDGLGRFYAWRGRYQEGELAFRLAVEKLSATASAQALRVLAKLLAWQGMFNHLLGLTRLANQLLEKSLLALDDPNLAGHEVRPERAFVLLQMGEVAREADREGARRRYEESLTLYQALNDPWGTANALASLGWLVQHLGAYDEARRLYEQSMAIEQRLGDRWGEANSLISLGSIVLYQGYPEEAERLVRQSISLRQAVGDQAGIARGLSKLGETMTWQGRFAEAQTLLEESGDIYRDVGLHDAAAFSGAMLGHAKMHMGDYEQAHQQAQIALTHFEAIGSQRGIGYTLLVMGWAMLPVEVESQALALLQKSMVIYGVIGQQDELAQTLVLLGYLAYRSGNIIQARQYLSEAMQIALRIRAFMPMMLALPAEALLAMARGDLERAVELYALASRYPFVANSHWFEAVAGRVIGAIAVTMPPEAITAAQQRGRAAALEAAVMKILSESVI